MPTAVDSLTKDSTPQRIRAAISSCISTEVKAGREQSQAVAMCYSMAKQKTGKTLSPAPNHMTAQEKISEGLK